MGIQPLAYTATPYDRAPNRRRDPQWTAALLADPGSRVMPFWRDRVLLSSEGGPLVVTGAAGQAVARAAAQLVLLGLDGPSATFAADLSDLREDEAMRAGAAAGTADIRTLAAALPADQSAALAYGRGMLYWHRHQRFCGACGAPADSRDGGHLRVCTGADCGRELFPRIEPAVIMLVEAPGPPARCLMARHHAAGPDSLSLLAGLVEIGESLEGTVRREVAEEAGVVVGEVTYQGSQGWPFPAGLMIGFRARAVDERIDVDDKELAEARWVTREDVARRILDGPGSGPSDSIGGFLLRSWALGAP